MNDVKAMIPEAIEIIRSGGMLILVDDEDRENEGDLFVAAEFITADKINFMVKYCRGLICLSLTSERCAELNLPLMIDKNKNLSRFGTAFTVSIEAKEGVSTGISAADRATTILTAVDKNSTSKDIVQPGHIFPIRARKGGVLVRAGQTEGSVDLAKLAGVTPAGVICEIMKDNGEMARMGDLEIFAKEHNLKIVNIADLIEYRLKHDDIINEVVTANMPTYTGDFIIKGYQNIVDGQETVALIKGDIAGDEPILTRVHSQCLTGDVFGSKRCDCGDQLHYAMQLIEKEGKGVILYMFQEGRGIGLINKIKAYKLQDEGQDTVEANLNLGFADDLRDYGFGAQVLIKLGIKKLRLLTNNPRKLSGLKGYGLEIVERVPIECEINDTNRRYMNTKKVKMSHELNIK